MKGLSVYWPLLVFLTGVFLFASCDTDKNIESPAGSFFLKMYGEDGDQTGVDLIVLNDGNFLLLGNTESRDITRIYLVKVNSEGEIIWKKKYGDVSGTTIAKDIEPITGGFAILATVQTPAKATDTKLIRINPDGIAMDSVVYGYDQNDDARSVTPLLDGGFIITGSTTRDTTDQNPDEPQIDPGAFSNIFHYRCNSNLIFEDDWYELYGALAKFDYGVKTIQHSSDTFYVFGYSNIANQVGKLNFIYYTVSEYGGPNNTFGVLGEINQDGRTSFVSEIPPEFALGNILLVGSSLRNTADFTPHVSILKTPLRFNALNDEGIDTDIRIGTNILEAVSATPSLTNPRGYLVLANEQRTLGTNIWLSKISQDGSVLWSVSLGSEQENDQAAAVKELPDGRIIVLGTLGIADNQTKMALFKLNSSGRLQE